MYFLLKYCLLFLAQNHLGFYRVKILHETCARKTCTCTTSKNLGHQLVFVKFFSIKENESTFLICTTVSCVWIKAFSQMLQYLLGLVCFYAIGSVELVEGFTFVRPSSSSHSSYSIGTAKSFQKSCSLLSRTNRSYLQSTSNKISVTFPPPDEAADMGIRDWPAQVKNGQWQESVKEGTMRYVLDGSGEVESSENGVSLIKVEPGTLINVAEDCTLSWKCSGDDSMTILTPTYEDGSALAAVAGILLATIIFLVTNSWLHFCCVGSVQAITVGKFWLLCMRTDLL